MFCFQTPFQRLVKRMTRFNSKYDAEKTLKQIRSVLDKRRYQFKVTNSKVVRIIFNAYLVKRVNVLPVVTCKLKRTRKTEIKQSLLNKAKK